MVCVKKNLHTIVLRQHLTSITYHKVYMAGSTGFMAGGTSETLSQNNGLTRTVHCTQVYVHVCTYMYMYMNSVQVYICLHNVHIMKCGRLLM